MKECPLCGGDKETGEPICHFCAENVLNSFKRFVLALEPDEVKVLEKALGVGLGQYRITNEDVLDYAITMHPSIFRRDLQDVLASRITLLGLINRWHIDYEQEIRKWLTS